jgi:SAM-dependent methyltransferase
MDPLGKRELISFYDRHLRDFGDSPQAVRWTEEGRCRRYEEMLRIMGDMSGKSLLDFGCGKGDFYQFLLWKGIAPLEYCGIDINGNLISLAREKFPDAEFLVLDIDEETFDRRFDMVLAIGVFNLRVAGIGESLGPALKKLFGIARESLHLNLLTPHVAKKSVELFYTDPVELLRLALAELSREIDLRHTGEDIFLSVYSK